MSEHLFYVIDIYQIIYKLLFFYLYYMSPFKSHTSGVQQGFLSVLILDIVLQVEAGDTLEPVQEQVS